MRGDAESTKPAHVVDNVARFAGEGKRRRGHVERDIVSAVGADLDAVHAQNAGPIGRRIGRTGRVAVIGEDDEFQAGVRRGGGDLIGRTEAVRTVCMHVHHARHGAIVEPGQCLRVRREGKKDPDGDANDNGGHEGRRHQQELLHRLTED